GGAEIAAIAAGLFAILEPTAPAATNGASRNGSGEDVVRHKPSNWKQTGRAEARHENGAAGQLGIRLPGTGSSRHMLYHVLIDGKSYQLELSQAEGRWHCHLDGREVDLDAVLARRDVLSLILDGKAYEIKREATADDLHFWVGSLRYAAELRDPRSLRSRRTGVGAGAGPKKLVAPMPGKVVRVLAREKDEVEAGQGVVVVEAM